ncbi:MAG: YdcF family protein [Bacteroidales bacterium]|nr:YdcF family protein [Bacteroidales bacterium]
MKKLFKRFFMVSGILFLFLILLSFTDYPYLTLHWLGTSQCKPVQSPEYIVVMGAGGLPGAESLLRCYYAAVMADSFPESKIIIAFPVGEGAFAGSENESMVSELLNRGIASDRIQCETKGTNTYSQAKEIVSIINNKEASLLIVSSPEHIFRCIKTFRKQGFTNVNGLPAFEQPTNDEVFYTTDDKKNIIKRTERNVMLRYNMWSYLQYEILVFRELAAIGYYKVKGYI